MFIAMNRFQVNADKEQDFIEIWQQRDSFLKDVPGFVRFNLIKGATENGITLFASHTEWQSRADFEAWLSSTSFKKAHANAGKSSNESIYAGPPKLELFEAVL